MEATTSANQTIFASVTHDFTAREEGKKSKLITSIISERPKDVVDDIEHIAGIPMNKIMVRREHIQEVEVERRSQTSTTNVDSQGLGASTDNLFH